MVGMKQFNAPEAKTRFGELVSRLEKPKFDPYRDAEQWHAFLAALVDRAQWVEDSGEADAIISGDRDLLGLGVCEGVPILTPAEFMGA
jgi:predicted nucleic acid-binding protein